jgi:anti-anti-sigma factor
MDFVYEYVNNIPVVKFCREDGFLVGEEIHYFGDKVIPLVKGDINKIAIDLRSYTYLNSFGLGELINIRNYFLERGVECILIVSSSKIHKLFDMVGIGDLFVTVANEKEL